MREILIATLLLGTALVGLAPAIGAESSETVTVTLVVETHVTQAAGLPPGDLAPLPGTASCQVSLPAGADGLTLLDQATADGCITGWEGQQSAFGTFVTAIDDLQAPGASCLAYTAGVCDWWEHSVNGQTVSYPPEGYTAADGDQVSWLYRNTA